MAKKAPASKNLELTIGYNTSKNFLVTNEDARGADAWKIDFAKLLGVNAAVFSGMKSVALTSTGGAKFTIDKGVVKYDAGTGFDYLAEGQTAVDTVSYTAKLLGGLSATLNLKFLVQGRNDAPKAAADSVSFTEDQTLQGASVLGNDTDVDAGAVLTASLVSGVKHGTLDFLSDGTFTYTPDKDYAGVDTFTYRAFDGKAYSEEVTVTLNGVEAPEPVIKVSPYVSGSVTKVSYAPGSHYTYYYHYDEQAEQSGYGYIDNEYFHDYTTENGIYANQDRWIYAYVGYEHQNESKSYSGPIYQSGGPIGNYDYSMTLQRNGAFSGSGIMEFDVREVTGLVSGATLKFKINYVQVYATEDETPIVLPPGAGTFDFYLYEGDGTVTESDLTVGSLAATRTFSNSTSVEYEITLDPDVINGILANDSPYLGLNIRSSFDDPQVENFFQTMSIHMSTAYLEFLYA